MHGMLGNQKILVLMKNNVPEKEYAMFSALNWQSFGSGFKQEFPFAPYLIKNISSEYYVLFEGR